jgi:hypothetical protein
MGEIETKAERIRKQNERNAARDQRARDAVRAVIDAESRRKATAAKTVRLREQRLARDAADSEAAAALKPAPAKMVRRRSATSANQLSARNNKLGATT